MTSRGSSPFPRRRSSPPTSGPLLISFPSGQQMAVMLTRRANGLAKLAPPPRSLPHASFSGDFFTCLSYIGRDGRLTIISNQLILQRRDKCNSHRSRGSWSSLRGFSNVISTGENKMETVADENATATKTWLAFLPVYSRGDEICISIS